MKNVVVTGASGLVGTRIIELLSDRFTFLPVSSEDMDITDADAVKRVLPHIKYDAVLHLAAYTNVDGAEKEKEIAYAVNETGTKNLFDVTSQSQKEFIYISTDFVFDGVTPPFTESSKPHPLSVYGDSKFRGEQAVADEAMILRISYPYRARFEGKKDIMRTLKSLLEQGKRLTMIHDSLMVPTFIDDIAAGIGVALSQYEHGIFHLVGKDALSPYDLAVTIAKTFHLDMGLVSKTDYATYFNGKAKRPQFCDIRSTKNVLPLTHSFDEALNIIKNQLTHL